VNATTAIVIDDGAEDGVPIVEAEPKEFSQSEVNTLIEKRLSKEKRRIERKVRAELEEQHKQNIVLAVNAAINALKGTKR
jgi:hypothetical protein